MMARARSSARKCATPTARITCAARSARPGSGWSNSPAHHRGQKTACRFRGCSCWPADDNAAREAYLFAVLDRPAELPDVFTRWFAARGWSPRAHQLELLRLARGLRAALLISPTGAGKTLAGFLPTLVELSGQASPERGLPSPLVGEGAPSLPPANRKVISTGRGIIRSGGLHSL